uniref:(northern house mosquito) hypothetical protein n=1 Tax=Culex pipiens TaxID=7175 RepID=A0A8D8HW12_CULPI
MWGRRVQPAGHLQLLQGRNRHPGQYSAAPDGRPHPVPAYPTRLGHLSLLSGQLDHWHGAQTPAEDHNPGRIHATISPVHLQQSVERLRNTRIIGPARVSGSGQPRSTGHLVPTGWRTHQRQLAAASVRSSNQQRHPGRSGRVRLPGGQRHRTRSDAHRQADRPRTSANRRPSTTHTNQRKRTP